MSHNPFKIYNASAGAGKTYTLVFEFLTILLQKKEPESFRELLAITFTNKAANEMKERIISQLQKLANNDLSDDEFKKYEEKTGLNKEQILEKSQKILTSILHNYAMFSVSTIDKFNLRLMRAFSQDMGLSLNFDVEMDVNEILKESVDVLFSSLEENNDLSDLITKIAIENLDEDKHWDISKEILTKANNLFQDKFLEELKSLESIPLEKLIAYREKSKKEYFKCKESIKSIAKEVLDFCTANDLTPNDFKYKKSGVISFFQKAYDGIPVPYGARQESIIESGQILGIKNHPLNDEVLSLVNEKYNLILPQIYKYNFWHKVYENINPITTLNEVDKKLEEIKTENNILLISEFNKIISDNIKNQPIPFIYEKIGNRYKNYFIDEFQDTSNLQWANLKPLLDNAIATNDSVMIVGDPKQSIYRFRGGNPELMIGLYNADDKRISTKELPKNWRSHEEVIQFNNLLYSKIANFLENPQYRDLYLNGNKQETNDKKGGYVQVDYLEYPKRGLGINFFDDVVIPNLIENIEKSLDNGFQYKEMAILVRQKSEGKRIAEALAARNIEVISNESLSLNNSQEVQLLLAFIYFLSDLDNKTYRANLMILLSNFQLVDFSEDYSEFYYKAIHVDIYEFIELLKSKKIDLSFIELPFKTLYDRVSSAIRAFGLDKKGGAYLTFFMDELLNFQQKKDVTANAFLEYWEIKGEGKSISMPEGMDAIQLMTIHKSKGLEFPVVFIPAATWSSKSNGVWLPINDEPLSKLYMDGIKSTDNLPPEMLAEVLEEEMQTELDSLNMLYVATTRAVEQLYIATQNIEKDSNKQLLMYFHELLIDCKPNEKNQLIWGEPSRVSKFEKIQKDTQNVPYFTTEWSEKISVSKEHTLLWDDTRASSIEYGKKMHAILEKLNHIEDMPDLLDKFEVQGLISNDEKSMIYNELNRLFNHQSLEKIFDASDFINERDFLSENGTIFRPDRLVKIDNKWVLIDYKTGEPLQKHKNQINQYAQDLNKLGYNIHKKYLLYLGAEDCIMLVD